MKGRISILFVFAALAVGCGQGKKAEQFKALPFPDTTPPGMMTEPQSIAEYMAVNYWNGITDPSRAYPSDSLLVSGVLKSDVEQKFANWTMLLDMVTLSVADKAVGKLYDRAVACERQDTSSNVFETFTSLAGKYLYDPNSPLRNEDHYNSFARRLSACDLVEPSLRGKYRYEAEMTSLNRMGTMAADFRFSDKNGRMHTLHGIEAPMTLLFFSNPGCEACMNIIQILKGDQTISSMIASGDLAVVNIYIDEDLQSWREYMPIYPEEWYNGFDPDLVIRTDNLYSVRAIPSLYLLDKDKKVIMKDAPENKLFNYLNNI
ncbi:MAG: DUF5106 domain-containing protein [Bacteroidales bacterium]|nr:DUF5106 domain-containing protein [Bacteroidales bacterium]